MVHPFRMIISGKGEEEDIEEQGVKAIKQTRIFSLFLPLGRTCGTVTVKIESHL